MHHASARISVVLGGVTAVCLRAFPVTCAGRKLWVKKHEWRATQALDDLQRKRTVKGEDRRSTIEFLKRSAKPQAALLLMVVPSVELLVEATRINLAPANRAKVQTTYTDVLYFIATAGSATYSARKASSGEIQLARRAGIRDASIADSPSTMTATNVTAGLYGFIP
jgi:hypothetical protein